MNKFTSLCLAAALGSAAAFAQAPEGGYFANLTDANGDPVSADKFYSITVDGSYYVMGVHQSTDSSFRLRVMKQTNNVHEVFSAWKIVPEAGNDGKFRLFQPHLAVEKSGNGYIKISNNNDAEGGGNIRPDGNASNGNLFWQVAIDSEGHENEYQLHSTHNTEVIIGNPSTSTSDFIGVYKPSNPDKADVTTTTNPRSHFKFTPVRVIEINLNTPEGGYIPVMVSVNATTLYNGLTNVKNTGNVTLTGDEKITDFTIQNQTVSDNITSYAIGETVYSSKEELIAALNEVEPGNAITATIVSNVHYYDITRTDMAGRLFGHEVFIPVADYEFTNSDITAVNNYTLTTPQITGGNGVYTVNAKFRITNMPFTTDGSWYYMFIHSDRHATSYEGVKSMARQSTANDEFVSEITPANINKNMAYKWRFEGDETNGFKIISYNMAEGESLKTPNGDTGGGMEASTDNNRWFLENDRTNDGGNFFFRCGGVNSNNRLNYRAPYLGTWGLSTGNNNDSGSKVYFTLAQGDEIPEVFAAKCPTSTSNKKYIHFNAADAESNANTMVGIVAPAYDGANYFTLEATDDNTAFYFRSNEATPRYAAPNTGSSAWPLTTNKEEAEKFILRVVNNKLAITVVGQTAASENSFNYQAAADLIVKYAAEARNNNSHWVFESIDTEAAYTQLKATAEKFLTNKVGYKYNPDAQTSIDEADAMKESDIFGALTKLASIEGTLILPTAGKFYAIRDYRYNTYIDGSEFLNHNNSGVYKVQHTSKGTNGLSAGQIWYLDNDMKGHNLLTGYGMRQGVEKAAANNAQAFTFEQKNLTVQPATFAVSVPKDSQPGYWYIYDKDGNSKNGIVDRNVGNNAYDETHCQFYIEEVEELPVTIDANGFASFSFPVAVELPDDNVTAYKLGADATPIFNDDVVDPNTGKVTQHGNKLHYMTLIRHEYKIVPANTPVILTAAHASETLYLPIVAETSAARSAEGNGLSGTAATIVKPEGTHYVVTSSATGDPDADRDGKDDGVNVKLTKHEAADIPGFSAYYTLPADYARTPDTIWLNGEGVPSSIVEINSAAERAATEAIYDLQGRRVNSAAHGLYIINGKKVYVK